MGELTSIKLPKDLVKRLQVRKRPHQALAGVIEELLNQTEKPDNAIKSGGLPPAAVKDTD